MSVITWWDEESVIYSVPQLPKPHLPDTQIRTVQYVDVSEVLLQK